MPGEDTITEWLHGRGRPHLTLDLARELATESRTGWFVAAHARDGYVIGKFSIVKWTPHHIIKRDDGEPLVFRSIEGARTFAWDELKVAAAVFDFR